MTEEPRQKNDVPLLRAQENGNDKKDGRGEHPEIEAPPSPEHPRNGCRRGIVETEPVELKGILELGKDVDVTGLLNVDLVGGEKRVARQDPLVNDGDPGCSKQGRHEKECVLPCPFPSAADVPYEQQAEGKAEEKVEVACQESGGKTEAGNEIIAVFLLFPCSNKGEGEQGDPEEFGDVRIVGCCVEQKIGREEHD